ncbi:hypothetical protein DXJ58_02120 [Vibrio fluvialis]|nr:hypothetical protein [Vibrio fluvialis]
MIIKRHSSDKTYHLIDERDYTYGNVYTAIIGKNGSGKSRFIKSIIKEFLSPRLKFGGGVPVDYNYTVDTQFKGKTEFISKPKKIIAVSTSPFDKFPLPRRHEQINNYAYLGLRDLNSSDLGLAYMSKIINNLISIIFEDPSRASVIGRVLNYLGYDDTISVHFRLTAPRSKLDSIFRSNDAVNEFSEYLHSINNRSLDKNFYFDDDGKIDEDKMIHTLKIVDGIFDSSSRFRFELNIDSNDIHISDGLYEVRNEFLFLIKSGMARLRAVTLSKNKGTQRIRISDASSGEQSVVMAMLGIASQIEDETLICIDEPEICLHPEWQEKYIELLVNTFECYRNCQFIIATHSPQVVSNLPDDNCYIMNMETGCCESSKEYQYRSADYQLASIFKAPGHRNEYLNRIALNVFVKVGKNKNFDDEDLGKLKVLNESFESIKSTDPLYDLILAINEMYRKYG